jgi:glycosyltransferase involved in cell wall biosynthesis
LLSIIMRILFLSDNFPPESNAPATRLYEHAVYWVQAGHQVTVLTGAPNFPEGKLFPGYQNRWYAVEMVEGIRVVRVKTYITANEGFLKRTLDYLSFMVMAVIAGFFQKRPDVIIATSPQFFAAVGGWMLAKLRRRPFIFELRDLWPASIAAVGAMKNRRLLQWLEQLELFLYRQATAIVALTNAFKADLTRRGIPASKISVVINGVELSRYAPQAKDLELVKQYDLTDKFVVGYIGTHGMAHALHRVLETAELLRHRPEIIFLFVGSGAAREQLVQEAKLKNLTNVRFIPRQPKEMMPKLWSLCNIALIPLKNDSLFNSVIPSKMFEAMGMGIPLLLSIPEGEATQIIRDTGAGVVVPPEQPSLLAEAITSLYDQPLRVAELTRASQQAASNFSRQRQAEKMLEVLEGVLSDSGERNGDKTG